MTPQLVAKLIHDFDSSGIHRIGSAGDYLSGQWLQNELQNETLSLHRQTVSFKKTQVKEAYLECAGLRIEALPLFDSPSTGLNGIEGTLAPAQTGLKGQIGFARFPPNAASIKGQALEQLRQNSPLSALVIATDSNDQSLAPINAQHYHHPLGPPILQVAGFHAPFLTEQAKRGAHAKLVSQSDLIDCESYNLSVKLESPRIALAAPVVVLTPRTGWWESTAERAGGIVAWMASVKVASQLHHVAKLKRDFYAYATCGHELGHLGLETLIKSHPHLVTEAHYWLHLGANLGCAANLDLFIRTGESDMAHILRRLLIEENYPEAHIHIEPLAKISGEGFDLNRLGARVLSVAGSNPYFHSTSDRWPGNVSTQAVAAIARASARWVQLQNES